TPISYGAPLGDAQLNAVASVPGTFVYTPAAGHVLAPGRYTLFAAFTPADIVNHTPAQAAAELVVEGPANSASQAATPEDAAFAPAVAAIKNPPPASEQETAGSIPPRNIPRETRTYKGAIYEKGDDGQWHLQQN
ncbi:MAG TPA: hypothetical protein VKU44_07630, partial [Terriglobia bacterium]|nr:hypothetical protein [Terriglobia bacterium]